MKQHLFDVSSPIKGDRGFWEHHIFA